MRAPSLFNPLLDIEDFRSLERDLGPKKRKAFNGISIGPCPNKAPSCEISTHHCQTSCDATSSSQLTEQGDLKNKTSLTTTSSFSPGSSIASTSKRKRGRPSTSSLTNPVKSPSESHEPSPPPRRRGRPSKSSLSYPPDKPWLLIGAYGPPSYGEKEAYWNGIGDFISDCILPVIIIGDLNGKLMDSECLNYVTSSNIPKGSRSPTGTCLKRARLDRALTSVEWRLAWPKAIGRNSLLHYEWSHEVSGTPLSDELYAVPDVNEITNALSSMGLDKAPGPDGLPKSTVYFSKGVPRARSSEIAEFLGMSKMKSEAKYLGLPLFRLKKNELHNYQFLVKKVLARIDGWKPRLLSKAGKACLIQTVGASLSIYAASSKGELDSKKTLHTIAWSSLYKSKFNGGLGFRHVKDINSASILKWGWKVLTDSSSLWSMIFKEKYHKGANFFYIDIKPSDSRLRKAILKSRPLLSQERFAAADPALAEAQMLGTAATFAVKKQFQKVIFYCHNALVITFFNDRAKERSNLNLEDAATQFSNTCQSLDCYKLLNIPRKDNFMAHNSAKWAGANLTIGEIELFAIDGEVVSDF
ncbi:hypothetical protein F8388_019689 [Cannabis sativa]|uniref:RNase H type-1 domain-containing protein n=1 Tax=Cannabis sativa TaxID=3483 RepID=A0A7J6FIV7_CANSA|nr:hypothetical protein F8388_019689 [Cannabis sativa]